MTHLFRTASLLMLSLALAACASSTPRKEPKRLLLNYEGPVAATPSTPRPRLVVRAVSVPDYLDRRELVRRVSAAEVVRDHSAFWAERPSKAITRWVTLALAAQRSDASIESFSTADGRAPDALLAITLDGFEPGADGILRLRGDWMYAPYGCKATQSGRFDADAPVAGDDAEASVAALQRALDSAVKELARQLPQLAFSVPPPR